MNSYRCTALAAAALLLTGCGTAGSDLSSDPMLSDDYTSVDLVRTWTQTVGGGALTLDTVNSEFAILPPADVASAVNDLATRAHSLGWSTRDRGFGESGFYGDLWTESGEHREATIKATGNTVTIMIAVTGQET